ncbi:metalloregulator ArsR/SmtB family transcription factor [Yinghuangia sp. ASG 101]|uniref:ArsR/SmtB family transcription factor n=1 Tax=Yinghuangia sp. ASG 101 TaxID=2896848 RepID=UPI001E5290B6|nr:metalloregulator ArsR/SmtB family transcription factor [Yinghuangia sp. ASG 101]UGQ11944.1 metalloregulator ArsR/SmtB family transcription factor [Yinghuangia sp. ASG 101]
MSQEPAEPAQVFRALGDPIRLSIVRQIAASQELACSALEDTLPVSKPTISYHTKILRQAGIIEVRKNGRNFFYTLRGETLDGLIGELQSLAPGPRPVTETPPSRRSKRAKPAAAAEKPLKLASGDDGARPTTPLLTW